MSDEIVAQANRNGNQIRLCARCGMPILRRGSSGQYCSTPCFRAAAKEGIHQAVSTTTIKQCAHCGVDFKAYAPHLKYCGRECYTSVDRPSYREFAGTWRAMMARCHNPNDAQYHKYGARGITVCEEWKVFENFEAWANTQNRPEGTTLDRENNNSGYRPDNCRFANKKTQQRNRRNTRFITAFGETKPRSAWPEDPRCLVPKLMFYSRIRRGVDAEAAMTTPPIVGTPKGHIKMVR